MDTNSEENKTNRITDYEKLEGTHKDYRVQLLRLLSFCIVFMDPGHYIWFFNDFCLWTKPQQNIFDLYKKLAVQMKEHSAKARIAADSSSLWGTSSISHNRYNQVLHVLEQLLYFLISQFWTIKWEFNIQPHAQGLFEYNALKDLLQQYWKSRYQFITELHVYARVSRAWFVCFDCQAVQLFNWSSALADSLSSNCTVDI